MKKTFNNAAQAGFTLIELVVVIVILGILAATALPKFVNMSSDARTATVQAAAGAINSASAMAHAQGLAKSMTAGDLTIDGQTVTLVAGYPSADTISNAVTLSGFDAATVDTTAKTTTWAPSNVADSTKCNVVYSEATGTASATVGDCS